MDKIRSFRGITAEKLIEVLKQVPSDTKICIELLGDNFPIKQVEECTYFDWSNGEKKQEHKGILIK
ncbi:hypothetical protein [Clostridium beijerinckii]|jgi:hypothetical protein|uniref:Uncharacterized protein n=1 Tax=Clostridium beijerinckii TaxID=1520 RepID=A0AAE2RW98_CLOBE|nr:hypothetical protein [Clostridium beijerinckii]MBF7811568.1 hypothetical protein [Clostridium beijerinckii]MBF7811921.1 hypothetical protein [Clostridium beijerinckii]MBF7811941.1 hypothetical protein [Clostridium beijerinckii]NRT25208.1 hypothetical protein [Clostridium beijerinckii]NRT67198.1 hypothetical protein [Clostridium beijerinckii]